MSFQLYLVPLGFMAGLARACFNQLGHFGQVERSRTLRLLLADIGLTASAEKYLSGSDHCSTASLGFEP